MQSVGIVVAEPFSGYVAVIRPGVNPVFVQPFGDLVRVAPGQGVDDPGAGQSVQMLRQPCKADSLRRRTHRLQGERLPHQRTALDLYAAELRLHILDDPVIGRGGRADDGHSVGHRPQDIAQAPVVGAEIMPPVGNAVGLIDDQQADAAGNRQQHLVHEFVIGEAFRRDQQGVGHAFPNGALKRRPVLRVRGIDRQGADTQPFSRFDLVPHQGEQGRHDERHAMAPAAEYPGRDEIYRALAPAGSLHDQQPLAPVRQRVDRFPLAGPERC